MNNHQKLIFQITLFITNYLNQYMFKLFFLKKKIITLLFIIN